MGLISFHLDISRIQKQAFGILCVRETCRPYLKTTGNIVASPSEYMSEILTFVERNCNLFCRLERVRNVEPQITK